MKHHFLFFTALMFAWIPNSLGKKSSPEECLRYINHEEESKGIEKGLLEAIARIESKLLPLSINVNGDFYSFQTPQQAVQFIKKKQKEGYKNISVGPMQLHLPSHKHHFPSLEAMIDPSQNIQYAAKLLVSLKQKTGSLEKAIGLYHSRNPHHSKKYKNRVFSAWAKIHSKKKKFVD